MQVVQKDNNQSGNNQSGIEHAFGIPLTKVAEAEAPVFTHSDALRPKCHRIIPGGAHTYAKGDDQYPIRSPGYIVRGQGCRVWDVDGNEFTEYGMGLRSVALGHAFPPVVDAVRRELENGSNFTRPSTLELECATALCSHVPAAEMVKFAKNGSDVTTAAVKLARAYTGRDMVAVCGDHPFFSVDDWFIGTTPMAAGIPDSIRNLTVGFRFNDLDSVRELFETYPDRIACIVMEPEVADEVNSRFLHAALGVAHEHGALFILDEIITGFRLHNGGVQAQHDIVPDLSTFGKALGNGFSIAALAGKREFMDRGGLLHDRERVFLLSTTFGAETHSLAAAIEVMRVYDAYDVVGALREKGERLRRGVTQAAVAGGVEKFFGVCGDPANLIYYTLDPDGVRSQSYRALFLQETIKRGLLMPSLVVSYSHSNADIDQTIEAIASALIVYRHALENGVERYLHGRAIAPVFRTRNEGIVNAQIHGGLEV